MGTLARVANRILRPLGLEIRRLPPRSPREDAVQGRADEGAALEAVLRRFAASRPPGSDLSDAASLRAYASDARLGLFHEMLEAAEARGVVIDGRCVADVGSGAGVLLWLIGRTRLPASMAGFDTFTEMNELARVLCPAAVIEDVSLAEVDGPFDVVFCTEVLEHLVDPSAAVGHLAGCLAPSGALVLTVPDGRQDRHPAVEPRADGTAYWGHIHFWSPESWPLFLRAALGDGVEIQTDRLEGGKNLAVVRPAR